MYVQDFLRFSSRGQCNISHSYGQTCFYFYQNTYNIFYLILFTICVSEIALTILMLLWVGTSTKPAEWLARRAEKSCQFICADSRYPGSPFVLHPVLSAVSVPFRDLQRQLKKLTKIKVKYID